MTTRVCLSNENLSFFALKFPNYPLKTFCLPSNNVSKILWERPCEREHLMCLGIGIFFFLIFLWECGFWISWSQLNFYFSSTYICHSPFGVVWYYDLMWGVFVFVFFFNEFGFWMLAPNGTTFSSFCSSVHIYLSSQLTLWSGLNFEVMWCPTLVVQSGWRKNGMNE